MKLVLMHAYILINFPQIVLEYHIVDCVIVVFS